MDEKPPITNDPSDEPALNPDAEKSAKSPTTTEVEPPPSPVQTIGGFLHATPLYAKILAGVGLGLLCGIVLGKHAGPLEIPSKLILRLLGALAPPLILLAVIQALYHAKIPASKGFKLISLLAINTVVAILLGLFVANVIRPGAWSRDMTKAESHDEKKSSADPLEQMLDNVPRSLLGPFGDNGKVLGVIFIALSAGLALRKIDDPRKQIVVDLVEVSLRLLIVILHWIIEVIPFAVFGIVASIVGTKGFSAFAQLGAFVVTVLIALALQLLYYLLMIRTWSWVRPIQALAGMRDALVMAFSTDSSTATMPVTYACLREKVGVREQSASLGALVGANFNNDGTALYEAVAALFISQIVEPERGPLGLSSQLMVVLTSIVASVGAAGIPEAGLVTMQLVFSAVSLPVEYIPILLTVDWFLDRSRTVINVMGDVTVSCVLDGKIREEREVSTPEEAELKELA